MGIGLTTSLAVFSAAGSGHLETGPPRAFGLLLSRKSWSLKLLLLSLSLRCQLHTFLSSNGVVIITIELLLQVFEEVILVLICLKSSPIWSDCPQVVNSPVEKLDHERY